MNVDYTRQLLKHHNRRMKRARWLYVLQIRSIVDREGTFALKRAAKLAFDRKLWCASCERDVQFSILRLMFLIDVRRELTHDWHYWLKEHGWCNVTCNDSWVKLAA